jgi:hypothetical protein
MTAARRINISVSMFAGEKENRSAFCPLRCFEGAIVRVQFSSSFSSSSFFCTNVR